MWNFTIFGIEFYYLISYLIIFSILGWVWESTYVSIKEKRLINRGYVLGPACTIYGFGAIFLYMFLRPVSHNYITLFFCGTIIATVLEYYTAAVMEHIFHTSWWDYTYAKYNYKGRICLKSSIAWGVAAILLFRYLIPFADNIIALFTRIKGQIIICTLMCVYAVDFVVATIAAIDVAKYIERADMLFDELEDYVKSSRLYAESAEVRERVSELRDRKRKHNYIKIYAKRLEIIHTIFMNDLINENEKLKAEMQQKLQSFTEHANIGGKWSGMQKRRILSAYPNLKARAQFYLEQKQNKL